MLNCLELHSLDAHIFNLPEEIFRTIFSYIDAKDLHLNLKKTCQKIENYVANFVEWEQTFMMLFKTNDKGVPMEAVRIIKFATKRPLFYNNANLPKIPHHRANTRLLFAATIHKQIVIGVDYGSLKFFRLEEKKWIRIYRHQPGEISTRKTKKNARKTYDVSSNSKAIWSPIGESSIILFHLKQEEEKYTIGILNFHKNEVCDLINHTITYSSCYVDAPEAMISLTRLCVMQKAESEILVVDYDCYSHSCDSVTNGAVWSGCLTKDKTKVIWKDTEHQIPFLGPRTFMDEGTTCFYVDDNIYLSYWKTRLDNKIYDRYSWQERKYYRDVFSISNHVYAGESKKSSAIGAKKNMIVVAAPINNLGKKDCSKLSIWTPINRLYANQEIIFFTRNSLDEICRCKMANHFDEQYGNELCPRTNSIFLLPVLQ